VQDMVQLSGQHNWRSKMRGVRAGNEIVLRAKMLDDLNDPAQASGVLTYIFEPTSLTGEDLDAFLADSSNAVDTLVPTYWEEGIFEADFTPPEDGPDGDWIDVWVGKLNGQTLSGIFSFEVSASGIWESLPGQINLNNWVDVIVNSGILATDGTSLEDEYQFSFLTEISPIYTDEMKVRIEVGSAIRGVPSNAIYLSILEASLEADAITFARHLNSAFYEHARREWATCRAAANLALNGPGLQTTKSKSLGDFSVTYNDRAVDALLDRVAACLQKWEIQVNTGGQKTQTPRNVIKGEHDPDRPIIARLWKALDEESNTSRRIPVANSKRKEAGHRRWLTGFKSRW